MLLPDGGTVGARLIPQLQTMLAGREPVGLLGFTKGDE